MPNVLILCDHRPKRSPSQRYRFEQYLSFLEQNGFKFTWSFLLDESDDEMFYSGENTLKKASILLKTIFIRRKYVPQFKNFDIIFIQREALFLGSSYFEKKAFNSGAKVIFDFDDSIWLADTSPGNKKWEWIKKPGKFFRNLKYAHSVIAGNDYLADKALKFLSSTPGETPKKVFIIPTTIDPDFHIPKPGLRNKETLTIGWSGSISTIKHFELLIPVLKKIKEKYNSKVQFKIIGDKNYKNAGLEIAAVEWTEQGEVDELNSLDIGIMPLPDDEWAKGKCGLKGLSYMACEVPVIMSSVGVNNQIITNGINGILVSNEKEWFEKLCQLIDDKELRIRIGIAGRSTVIEKYSVSANKDKYLSIFKNA
jgi:glycosyltransferase involved in cell wall biosynthesis